MSINQKLIRPATTNSILYQFTVNCIGLYVNIHAKRSETTQRAKQGKRKREEKEKKEKAECLLYLIMQKIIILTQITAFILSLVKENPRCSLLR